MSETTGCMNNDLMPDAGLLADYRRIRGDSERLCGPLEVEDYGLQSMPDASPIKWHLAHTSWFFETFLLRRFSPDYRPFHPQFDHLFNSYYVTHGQPYLRPYRGFLSRPTVADVYAYRAAVDEAMVKLIESLAEVEERPPADLIVLGLNHEQQHQELLLADLKHAFSFNPLRPAYRADLRSPVAVTEAPSATVWTDFGGGLCEIGADGAGFSYDNELPRHKAWLEDFALANRPVSNGDYLSFIEDGGYREPRWWLSEGWARIQSSGWQAPLYWEERDGEWWQFTLAGMRRLDRAAPICHLSQYEASAYASWAGARLPTESEWEFAACSQTAERTGANLRDRDYLQPVATALAGGLAQMFGDVWEWTSSAYSAYPGFAIPDGPVGEYNGKFMSGQMVLRGGSCVTPGDHIRASYRNFFYPPDRWQFSGLRLAADR